MTKREFNENFYNTHLKEKTLRRILMNGETRIYTIMDVAKDFKSVGVKYKFTPMPTNWNPNPRSYNRYARIYLSHIVSNVKNKIDKLEKIRVKLYNLN